MLFICDLAKTSATRQDSLSRSWIAVDNSMVYNYCANCIEVRIQFIFKMLEIYG